MAQNQSRIRIPENELTFRASRSAGPGGQNVNKLSTKVTVIFYPAESNYLSGRQKERLIKKLSGRINAAGQITVSSQKYRSQIANKNAATERLNRLIDWATQKPLLRKKTAPTRASVEKRLQAKKQRGQLKKQRSTKIETQ